MGTNSFIIACKNRQKSVIKLFLNSKKIDINERDDMGRTGLFYSCGEGDKEIVKLLIEAGADVNLGDNNSITPLHQGAMKGNKDILELLVRNGGDINALDFKGRAPIIYAIMQNKSEAAFKCIELGADTTLKDNDGHLPIDYAATNGLKELVNFLSSGEKDNFGNTPLHQACYNLSLIHI